VRPGRRAQSVVEAAGDGEDDAGPGYQRYVWVYGRQMLQALIGGEAGSAEVAQLARGRLGRRELGSVLRPTASPHSPQLTEIHRSSPCFTRPGAQRKVSNKLAPGTASSPSGSELD